MGKTAQHSALFQGGVPQQMPPLPAHFVARPGHFERLKAMLLDSEGGQPEALVVSAIYGLGGIGKSVLAAALCHDLEVRSQFPDGILWVTLGQQPDLQACLGGWIQALRDFDYKPTTVAAASQHLWRLLHDRRVLLVVDDVWEAEHLEPFQVGGEGCRLLVTTREAMISQAARYDLDVMAEEEALLLIAAVFQQAEQPMPQLREEDAIAFAKAVGYLPLALELAAGQVAAGRDWRSLLSSFNQAVADLAQLDALEAASDLSEAKRRQLSLRACFNLSLQRLAPLQLVLLG